MASSRIQQLAIEIATSTALIDQYLKDNQLPQPSFEPEAPTNVFRNVTSEIQEARDRVIEASVELQQLLAGNFNLLTPNVRSQIIDVYHCANVEKWAAGNTSSLQAIFRFKVATRFPVGEEISYSDLAERCSLFEHDLRRLVRYAIVHHRVFREPRKGYVAHTAASALLAGGGGIDNFMGLVYEETSPAHAHVSFPL
jgi:hypothetical protein